VEKVAPVFDARRKNQGKRESEKKAAATGEKKKEGQAMMY